MAEGAAATAAGPKRQFVARIKEQSAAEVREQQRELVARAMSSNTPVALDMFPEPKDYEQELRNLETQIREDPMSNLLIFPGDDWDMQIEPRVHRAEQHTLPPDAPDFVQETAKVYTRDWLVFQKQYGSMTQHPSRRPEENATRLKEQDFNVDILAEESVRASTISGDSSATATSTATTVSTLSSAISVEELLREGEDPVKGMLIYAKGDTEQKYYKARQAERVSILSCINHSSPAGAHVPLYRGGDEVRPLSEHKRRRFLLTFPRALRLNQCYEPMFLTLTLYDARLQKRVSENFYFDFNEEAIANMLNKRARWMVEGTRVHRAILSLSHDAEQSLADVFAVVRIEKTLEGDVAKAAEPYMKEGKEDRSDKSKLAAYTLCERLGAYRMPFAFSVFNIMESVDGPESEAELFLWQPEKLHEEELYKLLADLRGDKSKRSYLKKYRKMPGALSYKIKALNAEESVPCSLTPSMRRVHPFLNQENVALEVQEFPAQDLYVPHSSYRHHLYVYPLSVDYKSTNYRNISCRVELLDREGMPTTGVQGLPCIYARNAFADKLTSTATSVAYHDRNPEFHEEVKIQLPERLTERHHLLFTFFHVSCKQEKGETSVAKPIGRAWVPITNRPGQYNRPHDIPICEELFPGYLNPKAVDAEGVKYIDGKKALFSVYVRLDSTVLPADLYIANFFGVASDSLPRGDVPRLLNNLWAHADKAELVQFMYPIVDRLLNRLVSREDADARCRPDAFLALVQIVHTIHEHSATPHHNVTRGGSVVHPAKSRRPNPELQAYLKYAFDRTTGTGERPLFEELADQLHALIESEGKGPGQGDGRMNAIRYVWFYLGLIVKSMALHIKALSLRSTPRKGRFHEDFLRRIELLIATLYQLIVTNVVTREQATEVNYSIALFLRDLLTLADRGRVFIIIRRAFVVLHQTAVDRNEITLRRLDAIRILCLHEHYVALNLPLGASDVPEKKFMALTNGYKETHYLAGLLMTEVFTLLKSSQHRSDAIHLLLDMLVCHDEDPRLNTREQQARVSTLYLPVLTFLRDFEPYFLPQSAGSSVALGAQSPRAGARRESVRKPEPNMALHDHEVRHLLIIWLHLVKTVDQDAFRRWLRASVAQDKQAVVLNTHHALRLFEYPGRGHVKRNIPRSLSYKEQAEQRYAKGGTGVPHRGWREDGAAKAVIRAKHTSIPEDPSDSPPAQRRVTDDAMVRTASVSTRHSTLAEGGVDEVSVKLAASLSAEAAITTLDTVEVFIDEFPGELQASNCRSELMEMVFDVYRSLLQTRQSKNALIHIFASLQCFVNNFPALLFQGPTDCCAELVEQVFRHCSSALPETRKTAASFLYLLMRKNFEDKETGAAFSRVKVLSLIALHHICTNSDFRELFLLKSLATLISNAKADRGLRDTNFPEDVEELAMNLYKILVHTAQIKKFEWDPEMTIDLYLRIANGYMNSPDLRLENLTIMAKKHEDNKNYSEAGQCYVHAAALVAEHLQSMEAGMPKGCSAFERVSPNVLEAESAVSDDIRNLQRTSSEKEGIYTHKLFGSDGNGVIQLLNSAIESFKAANLYECVNEVYRVLMPMFEARHEYHNLAEAHRTLARIFDQILEVTEAGKRYPGAYFRVGFFGDLFEPELRNVEFIYKEAPLTRLPQVCERLHSFYRKQYGDRVELLADSKEVDPKTLEAGKAYLQVTYVEPYFNEHELKRRGKFFEQNMNIKQFVFETPFTAGGSARGRIEEQMKKRILLTVEHSFPYLTMRLRVVKKTETILQPLEVAIESIETKTRELTAVLTARPLNIKMLQLRLQGAVSVSVNEGPVELANAFLNANALAKGGHDPKQLKVLRQGFGRFLKACSDALEVNKSNLMHNQAEYHESLQESFGTLRQHILPLLSTAQGARQTSRLAGGDSTVDSSDA